jgi:hypothetical protein
VIRRILPLGGILAGLLALAPAAGAAQNFGMCSLDGLAKLTPGLAANQPAPGSGGVDWGPGFSYSFSGTLSSCQGLSGAGPGGPAGGTISAGEQITINGVKYLAPGKPSGNGGCTGSHTSGTAIVKWDDGTLSAVDYTTEGAAAVVGLTGDFLSSITLMRVDPDPVTGLPVEDKFNNLAFGGDYAGGPLVFHPADPTQCTGAGVTEAPITGAIGHGNYS